MVSIGKFACAVVAVLCCLSCSNGVETITYEEPSGDYGSLPIHEGLYSSEAQRIRYKAGGKTRAIIELGAPVKVSQTDRKEPWGYYQFPSIAKTDDGTLIVSWSMVNDSHESYGKKSDRPVGPMISKDGGITWQTIDKSYNAYARGYNGRRRNGDILEVVTPESKDIRAYDSFPEEVGRAGNISFYPVDSLPDEFRGVYFKYRTKDGETSSFHATLKDPGLLRYAIDGKMPVVWWGNIEEMADNSLVAGVYPCYYLDENGLVQPVSASFYKSVDNGRSWVFESNIPFKDGNAFKGGDHGFTEPAFKILKDSTFICVMRTGSRSSMHKTFSYDRGKTWTDPVPFTPNGVMPNLLKLDNGVLALSSGRPGVQLRFSLDGTGERWTEPIDMIHFMKEDGTYTLDVSCGYTSMIENGRDSFFLVYSDFTTKNREGEPRKSIWCRKVRVIRKRMQSGK